MNNTRKYKIIKHTVYSLILFVLYILQATPGLFSIRGIKPLLVIPVAISIAMFEGEFIGGIYGTVAGLLCDIAGSSFLGFNGFFLCIFCALTGLMIIHLLRCNLFGCLLFVAVSMLLLGSIEFLFAYGMWGHDNVWKLYVFYTLPAIIYTLFITPLEYLMIKKLSGYFAAAIQP